MPGELPNKTGPIFRAPQKTTKRACLQLQAFQKTKNREAMFTLKGIAKNAHGTCSARPIANPLNLRDCTHHINKHQETAHSLPAAMQISMTSLDESDGKL